MVGIWFKNHTNNISSRKLQLSELMRVLVIPHACADSEGGAGGPDPPPLHNHQSIGFLSNTDQDHLKITKFQASIQCLVINGVSLAGRR